MTPDWTDLIYCGYDFPMQTGCIVQNFDFLWFTVTINKKMKISST